MSLYNAAKAKPLRPPVFLFHLISSILPRHDFPLFPVLFSVLSPIPSSPAVCACNVAEETVVCQPESDR